MKAFFLSRLLREKLLLIAFLLIGVFIWTSSLSRRLGAFSREWRLTSTDLTAQKMWLSNQKQIEEQSARVIKAFDPGKTLDKARLVGELNGLFQDAALTNTNIEPSRDPERTDQFAITTLQFSIRKADMASLLKFYNALAAKSPYIGLEQVSLSGDPGNPAQLNAVFKVSSVGIVR